MSEKVTRYWISGTNFCCGEGELTVNKDFYTPSETVHYGHHFYSKQEAFNTHCSWLSEKQKAFNDYCINEGKNIENLKNEIEVLKDKL